MGENSLQKKKKKLGENLHLLYIGIIKIYLKEGNQKDYRLEKKYFTFLVLKTEWLRKTSEEKNYQNVHSTFFL